MSSRLYDTHGRRVESFDAEDRALRERRMAANARSANAPRRDQVGPRDAAQAERVLAAKRQADLASLSGLDRAAHQEHARVARDPAAWAALEKRAGAAGLSTLELVAADLAGTEPAVYRVLRDGGDYDDYKRARAEVARRDEIREQAARELEVEREKRRLEREAGS